MRCGRRHVAMDLKDRLFSLRTFEAELMMLCLDQDAMSQGSSVQIMGSTVEPAISELPPSLRDIMIKITDAFSKLSSDARRENSNSNPTPPFHLSDAFNRNWNQCEKKYGFSGELSKEMSVS